MKLSIARIVGAHFLMALVGCTLSFALPPDQLLLSLLPPGSQIVGGAAPLAKSHRGNFLIFTRANTLDIEDFFSLIGADASAEIHQLAFAASAGRDGTPPEHSVLAIGHFDARHVYRFATAMSIAGTYHGVTLFLVHPFQREHAILNDDRLLAIVNSRLAIFGTTLSVKEEVDRFLNGTPADAAIMRELSQLLDQNETWCLISSLSLNSEIARVLKSLDPAFADIEAVGDGLLFGIKYGRKIEFEYVIRRQADPQATIAPSRPHPGMFTSGGNGLLLAPDLQLQQGNRHVVKISKGRYQKWLANLTQH
jgi:hypothetical protein